MSEEFSKVTITIETGNKTASKIVLTDIPLNREGISEDRHYKTLTPTGVIDLTLDIKAHLDTDLGHVYTRQYINPYADGYAGLEPLGE